LFHPPCYATVYFRNALVVHRINFAFNPFKQSLSVSSVPKHLTQPALNLIPPHPTVSRPQKPYLLDAVKISLFISICALLFNNTIYQ